MALPLPLSGLIPDGFAYWEVARENSIPRTHHHLEQVDKMQSDSWQQLLALESVDVVTDWHERIHSRTLSMRRALEVTAPAKQAREFFRNAANADNTVRPLLTFYGVASLSRAATLLLKRDNGEAGLTSGHGIETDEWRQTLSGEPHAALRAIGGLKIRTCAGLFHDFVTEVGVRMCLHLSSSAVDGRLQFLAPEIGTEVKLHDLLCRLPDVTRELAHVKDLQPLVAPIQMSGKEDGMTAFRVTGERFKDFEEEYVKLGCVVDSPGAITTRLKVPKEVQPQFVQAYITSSFASIPSIFIAKPFSTDLRLSQISMTYLLSYYLGMLTRYFPTHWVALHQGARGDSFRPAIQAAQRYVERVFPKLVIELLMDVVENPGVWQLDSAKSQASP